MKLLKVAGYVSCRSIVAVLDQNKKKRSRSRGADVLSVSLSTAVIGKGPLREYVQISITVVWQKCAISTLNTFQ